jgi:hypothetical protein
MSKEPRYRAYWERIQQRVCSVCLDQAADGVCGLSRRICPIERQLPLLAGVFSSIHSRRMDEYVAVLETHVCARCPEQDSAGRCGVRETGDCALQGFLPLVLDAIEDVDASLES